MVTSLAADGCLVGFVRKQVVMQLETYACWCVFPRLSQSGFRLLFEGFRVSVEEWWGLLRSWGPSLSSWFIRAGSLLKSYTARLLHVLAFLLRCDAPFDFA